MINPLLLIGIFLINSLCFSAASSEEMSVNDFLKPSPVTIKFKTRRGHVGEIPIKDVYESFKMDLLASKECNVASFDDDELTMTFHLDPMEVDACMRATSFGKKYGIGEPFKYLRTDISCVDEPCALAPQMSYRVTDYVEWIRESRIRVEKERETLLKAAKEYNKTASSRFAPIDKKITKSNFLEKILKKHQGLAIGERAHDDPFPKILLEKSMKQLAKIGVGAIFLEHLVFDTMADDLKYAAMNKDANQIPARIRSFVERLERNFLPGYLSLIETATNYGITVVPIDTTLSRLMGWNRYAGIENTRHRTLGMNYVATNIIKLWQAKNPDKKFIVLMGMYHASTYNDEKGRSVIGVADQLAIPKIYIDGKNPGKTYSDAKPIKILPELDGFSAVVHAKRK